MTEPTRTRGRGAAPGDDRATPRGEDPLLYEDPLGDDELEAADRARRRRGLRPVDRGPYDYLGYSWWVWTAVWLIAIGLLVWGAWVWSY